MPKWIFQKISGDQQGDRVGQNSFEKKNTLIFQMILENCELKWNFRMQNVWSQKQTYDGYYQMFLMPWEISPFRMPQISPMKWDGFPR